VQVRTGHDHDARRRRVRGGHARAHPLTRSPCAGRARLPVGLGGHRTGGLRGWPR
jgi:hypothetical protein